MKKLTIIIAVLIVAGLAYGQFIPKKIGLEPQNVKVVACLVQTAGASDATYPIWIAPCAGYVATVPMISSASGSAAADTSTTQFVDLYVYVVDSVATAASDTISYYTTKSATGANTMSALKRYRTTAVSADSARIIKTGDVVCLRSEESGTCTAITDLIVQFNFVPLRGQNYLPK